MNGYQAQLTPEQEARGQELNQARILVKQARFASMVLKDFLAQDAITLKPDCVRAVRRVTDLLEQVPDAAFEFADVDWKLAMEEAVSAARHFRDADEDDMDATDLRHAVEELRTTARTLAGAFLSGGGNSACPFGRWYDRLLNEMNSLGGQQGIAISTHSAQHEKVVTAEGEARAFARLPEEAQKALNEDARAMRTWRRTGRMPMPTEVKDNLRYKYESLR